MMAAAATAVQSPSTGRVLGSFRKTVEFVALAAVPLSLVMIFGYVLLIGFHPFDFSTFWTSGVDVLHGRSPYPHVLPEVAQQRQFRPFVYPAPAAVALAPISLLPLGVASAFWGLLSVASIAGALYLLGVRDWRCYGIVFLWPATWSGLTNGTISPELVLGCAALWRFRSRVVVAGLLLAALVVFKLYLWPLGVWLLVTRRLRSAVWSVGIAVAAAVGGWAAIGFSGLQSYPHLLGRLTALVADHSYSPYALVRSLGGSPGVAKGVMFALGAVVLAAVVDRGRSRNGDAAAFVLAIAASLVLSPIVWPHYLPLVCVALALAQPRFGVAWVVPATLGAFLPGWSSVDWGAPLVIAVVVVVYGLLFAWSARRLDGVSFEESGARRPRASPASPSAAPS